MVTQRIKKREKKKPRWSSRRLFSFFFLSLGIVIFTRWAFFSKRVTHSSISKSEIAQALESSLNENRFPTEFDLSYGLRRAKVVPKYSLDLLAQHKMEKLFSQYRPDYGAFVAVNAQTGEILTLISYTRESKEGGNLVLRSSFPAASIFKVVTAAAAIDQKKADPNTIVSYTGANHTLYKRNLTNLPNARWARKVTLKEAFARSINSVFGKVGLYLLKPQELNEYAQRFQFNRALTSDIPVQPGSFFLEQDNDLKVAEAASGFTRMVQMSPLQGAMMAASIINDGVMVEPYLVSELRTPQGEVLYKASSQRIGQVMELKSALELRDLMRETVVRGTSQKSFRDLLRKKKMGEVEMGGKTGHLSGLSPKGKYDWFVGYGTDGNKKIALAALTINEETWRVKASYLARQFFEGYFRGK